MNVYDVFGSYWKLLSLSQKLIFVLHNLENKDIGSQDSFYGCVILEPFRRTENLTWRKSYVVQDWHWRILSQEGWFSHLISVTSKVSDLRGRPLRFPFWSRRSLRLKFTYLWKDTKVFYGLLLDESVWDTVSFPLELSFSVFRCMWLILLIPYVVGTFFLHFLCMWLILLIPFTEKLLRVPVWSGESRSPLPGSPQ